MTTVQKAFFDVARRLKLTTIFGNPGSTEETLLKNFPEDFRYILALQEAPRWRWPTDMPKRPASRFW
jgi:benzoylformate decarboxylase